MEGFLTCNYNLKQTVYFDLISRKSCEQLDSKQILMEDIRECFTLNAWCGSWHLFCAAHALKMEINQIHLTIQKGHKNFVNRKLTPYSSTIHISWTHTVDKNVNKNSWTPNHLCCLLSTTKSVYDRGEIFGLNTFSPPKKMTV
ncbi:hypothetical protein BpHYR1_021417 [Brachionus plicatilis]|uniref:Uncharacterized protein n=1 Tax=Brachionus plicatilis TaxID=10195 RepID=A0A3M7PTB1_BRAPC|nr:hypothetical protein BpHYR1_021417 [Brachionus plicatilis]